jgi:hypothetical protein
VGFKSTSPDQDFAGPATDTWLYVDEAINDAYQEEVSLCVQECGSKWLHRAYEDTWPSGQNLYTLPEELKDSLLHSIFDITSNSGMGEAIWMGDRMSDATVVWRDNDTLEWRDSGPGSDVTLRIFHVAQAKELKDTSDIPELIPERHRRLLALSAAIILRIDADESAPRDWFKRRDERRHSFWKEMSATRPLATGARPVDSFVADFY